MRSHSARAGTVASTWASLVGVKGAAAAGPAANLVLAIVLLAVTRSFYDPGHGVFWSAVAFLGFLQITALLLNQQLRFRGFFRAAYFLPVMTSLVVVATIFASPRRPSSCTSTWG